jgi:hypothetical protein
MAGALWQMAAPGTELRRFYEETPELAHAVIDVAPRLTDILTALLRGYRATQGPSARPAGPANLPGRSTAAGGGPSAQWAVPEPLLRQGVKASPDAPARSAARADGQPA